MSRKVLLAASPGGMISGASWSLLGLASNLLLLGDDVTILLPNHDSLEEECKKRNIPYKVIKRYNSGWCRPITIKSNKLVYWCKEYCKRIWNFFAYKSIYKFIETNGFDIVHSNASTEYLVIKAATAANIKAVWHIREFLEEDLFKMYFNKKYSYELMNKADCIIAISEAVKNKYQPVLNNSLRVVYNGIDVKKYYCERSIFKDNVVTICIAGRISAAKGQDQLVDAIIELSKRGYTNLRVQIIGSKQYPDYYDSLVQKISNNNMNDVFEYVPFTKTIEEYFKNVDIICVCSRMEAFGRITVEGMSSGALVIGANSGGTPELIESYNTGLLYEEGNISSLSDQLQWAIDNKEDAINIAKNGQKWACEKFTAERNAIEIHNIYEALVGE